MTDKMLSRKEGGVGYVIFNNPERHNAVSLEMWAATRVILDDFRADDSIRVVVLTRAGGYGALRIGTTGGEAVAVAGEAPVPVASLQSAFEHWLPAYMNGKA